MFFSSIQKKYHIATSEPCLDSAQCALVFVLHMDHESREVT
jgi:hypothetical protein